MNLDMVISVVTLGDLISGIGIGVISIFLGAFIGALINYFRRK